MKRLLWGLVALVFLWLIFERFRMESIDQQLEQEIIREENLLHSSPAKPGNVQQIPMHSGESPAPTATQNR
ncbi:hypothetical protein [Bdellovibrio sp. HCB337]|uniref:hypothetical protein n=1 Tax=Bdellovibrio sp. HCB337 TaxID=3394358 RepID=UPI0039A5F51F